MERTCSSLRFFVRNEQKKKRDTDMLMYMSMCMYMYVKNILIYIYIYIYIIYTVILRASATHMPAPGRMVKQAREVLRLLKFPLSLSSFSDSLFVAVSRVLRVMLSCCWWLLLLFEEEEERLIEPSGS